MVGVLVLTHAHSHKSYMLMLWEDSLPGSFPFPRAFVPATICCRCGGRLPGCFSPSRPTWQTLPLMSSLRSYFYRQLDCDDDVDLEDEGGDDAEEVRRRRSGLLSMIDLLTRIPRQGIF